MVVLDEHDAEEDDVEAVESATAVTRSGRRTRDPVEGTVATCRGGGSGAQRSRSAADLKTRPPALELNEGQLQIKLGHDAGIVPAVVDGEAAWPEAQVSVVWGFRSRSGLWVWVARRGSSSGLRW